MVSLKLFGGASLESEQGPLTGPAAQRRRLALLALLAASHPRGLSREKLMAFLWPERGSEPARNLLSQAVYALRKALGEEAVLAAGDELRFNPGVVVCDVVSFEQALAAGETVRAVALYAGPFLDGFLVDEAPEFERWVEGERERYRRAFAGALEELAGQAAAEGELARAVEWWRRRVAEDPYTGRVTLRLMEALEAAGDRAGALRQARIHAALLEQEFGAEPDPAVAALAERLRREPVAAPDSAEAPAAEPQAAHAAPVAAPRAGPEAAPGAVTDVEVAPEAVAVPTGGAEPGPPAEAATVAPCCPPPAEAPAVRRVPGWRRIAVPIAAALGLAAVLSLGWLRSEAGTPTAAVAGSSRPDPQSVAVLPCANLGSDASEEYFSDGLTEELIASLSQVRALRVVARTSSFAFKGENRDVREIAAALNVGAIVECRVRRDGKRVRVTAHLINAADGFHLWTDTYEREVTDVFALQSDIALRIARSLEAELTPAERSRLARRPTESLEAYTLYLKGRSAWSQRGSGLATAIEYFQRAIEVDPNYARAYAGLASTYGPLGVHGHLRPREGREKMRAAALRALELDDELGEAHAVLAAYLHVYEWDWAGAEREYLRAIELDPNNSTAYDWYGFFLDRMGRFDEAIVARRRAIELDPLAPNTGLAAALRLAGRYGLAKAAYREVIDRHPNYWQVYEGLGMLLEATGELAEAARAFEDAGARAGRTSRPKAGLARVLARSGRRAEARRLVEELRSEAERSGIHTPTVASTLVALGDVDGAIAWLEAAYDQRHPDLISLNVDPHYAELRRDPRFLDLLRRIGFPS